MYDLILIRFGEIALKGENRINFVQQLINNIDKNIKNIADYKITRSSGRIFIHSENNIEKIMDRLKMIPGIVSFSPAVICSLDYESLEIEALKLFKKEVKNYPTTFKVITRRANKQFKPNSMEVSRKLGAKILGEINDKNNKISVDVHNPQNKVYVEIRNKHIYIYSRVISGPGGLPIGSSSKGLLLLSGGIDSPVAGWMAMKRGIKIEALYFHSFPFTSDRAKEKVIDLTKVLSQYGGKIKLHIGYFTEIQKEIQEKCPERYNITIMRRMMFRMATIMARINNNLVLLSGESVGQVASQTLESMNVINAVTNIPVLRPLITMDKTEIMAIARKIGTYKISIQPYEDCCTVFLPDHPVTKPRLENAIKAEAELDIEGLLERAIGKSESMYID